MCIRDRFLLKSNDECIDLDSDEHRSSPQQGYGTCLRPSVGSAGPRVLKPVDLFNKVAVPEGQVAKFDPRDITQSAEAEALAKKEGEVHEKNVKVAEAYWSQKAKDKDWDCVIADLSLSLQVLWPRDQNGSQAYGSV